MRTTFSPSRTQRLARLAAAGSALIALAVVAFGCGGGGGEEASGPTPGTPFVTPAGGLPSAPPDAAQKAGYLVYRDTIAAQVFTRSVS